MEALSEIVQWWESLRGAAKVACTIAVLAVGGGLGAGMYHAYSRPAPPWLTTPVGTDAVATQALPRNILSLPLPPLPGTRERKQADIRQSLERALTGYDYIASAQALFATPLGEVEPPASPRLALQLQLDPACPPPQDWVENLVAFVCHTVPEVEPTNLLVTDTSGAVLFSQGRPTPPAPTPAATNPVPAHLNPSATALSTPWLAASGLGAICVVVALALFSALHHRVQKRRALLARPTTGGPAPADQPLALLSELTAPNVTALLRGERPEVAGVVLAHVPDEATAGLVRQALHLAPDAPTEPTRPPRTETLLALAEALRVKTISDEDSPRSEPTAATLRGDPEGD